MSELATATVAPRAMAASATPVRGAFEFLGSLKSLTAQPAVVKSLPALALAGVIGFAALLWAAVSAPPARDLFSGLPDEDKAAVAEALGSAGIAYELDRGTGAISVAETDYHQARMLLAAQGLPKSAPDGNEMIGSLPLGSSRAVENERLRAAKELDLARTIEAIDAVQSARVHLALEAPSVFLRDRSRRAASVMLRLAPGRALGDAQVQAIVHLVASSVPGLAPDGVSVVDQNGRLLSSGQGDGLGAASDRQVALQAKIEERYLQSLAALLTPIVGAGNFTAEVHADVDFSEVQATREGFPQEASAVAREERAWTSAGREEEASGIPGALSNQAPTATTVAAAPGAKLDPKTPGADEEGGINKTSENYKRNYALGREVSVTRKPTGEVKRLTVAVAIKNPAGAAPRSKQELASIEALIKSAVGFNAGRGDTVALNALTFAPVEDAQSNWWEASWMSTLARNIGAVLLGALVIFGVGLPMLKKNGLGWLKAGAALGAASHPEAAKLATTMEKQLSAALAQKSGATSADITLDMIEAAPSYEARAALIRNFVRENPARAALVIRDLLRTEKPEGLDKNA
jgi:flagellar M-ring protein FliF